MNLDLVHWHRHGRVLLFGLGYFALQEVGLRLLFPSGIAAVWPPAGLAVAVMLLTTDRRRWLPFLGALAVANFAGNILHGRPLALAVGFPVANVVETLAAGLMVRRLVPKARQLARPIDVVGLILLAGAVAPAVGALLAGAIVVAHDNGASFWDAALGWWTGDGLGIVVVTPLVLSARLPRRTSIRPARALELVGHCFVLVAVVLWTFSRESATSDWVMVGLPVLVVVLLWPSTRLGSVGVAIAIAALSVPAVWQTAHHRGPFAAAIPDANGQVIYLQIFLAMITIAHLTLAALIAQRDQSHAQLAAANEQLRRQTATLERSNAELTEFSYIVSHDLSEPLRAISGFVQLLDKRYTGRLDERADRYIANTVDGVARMQRLIGDILTYSRVERPEAAEPVDTAEVFANTLDTLAGAIAESGATVRAGGLPHVLADETSVSQLFQNLIANALKFRRPDVAPIVDVSAYGAGDLWWFTVADNGIGIEDRHHERVFKMFQRLHTSEQYPGSGIGLALCRKIVERHGGRIWVECRPTGGSEFHFELPRVPLPVTNHRGSHAPVLAGTAR